MPVDLWAMVFWRNVFGSAALALIILATSKGSLRGKLRFGRQQLALIAFGAFGTITYLAAFKYTSVANISIVYATAPLITAAAAWVCLRERMARKTLLASVVAILGVGLTVAHSIGAGTLFGDLLAFLMTVSLSLMAVAARGNTLPALVTALTASIVASVVVLPLGYLEGASFTISWSDALWLAGFGIVTMAIALPCYLAGAAQVPAARGMLISALEMPLAPLWVWLAFSEIPALATVIGGIIVALAILYEMKASDSTPAPIDVGEGSPIEKVIRRAVEEGRNPSISSRVRGEPPLGNSCNS